MRHPFIKLFHLFSFLQMPNDCTVVDLEFFGIFSCSCKMISFHDPFSWLLSTSDGQPLCLLSSRLSFCLQNFLKHPCTIHLLAVPGPNVFLMLQVFSAALQLIWNLNKLLGFAFCLTSFPKSKINIKYKASNVISRKQTNKPKARNVH